MKILGWVIYDSPIKPYNDFNRHTYYQVLLNNKNYYVGNKNSNISLSIDEIKSRFKPSNGYDSWDKIFRKEVNKYNKNKVTKNHEDKID